MTDPTCATGCGRPSRDAYLCHGCTAKLEKILAEFPAQLRELETTLTRQSDAIRGLEAVYPFIVRATADAIADQLLDMANTSLSGFEAATWHRAEQLARLHGSQAQTTEDGQKCGGKP